MATRAECPAFDHSHASLRCTLRAGFAEHSLSSQALPFPAPSPLLHHRAFDEGSITFKKAALCRVVYVSLSSRSFDAQSHDPAALYPRHQLLDFGYQIRYSKWLGNDNRPDTIVSTISDRTPTTTETDHATHHATLHRSRNLLGPGIRRDRNDRHVPEKLPLPSISRIFLTHVSPSMIGISESSSTMSMMSASGLSAIFVPVPSPAELVQRLDAVVGDVRLEAGLGQLLLQYALVDQVVFDDQDADRLSSLFFVAAETTPISALGAAKSRVLTCGGPAFGASMDFTSASLSADKHWNVLAVLLAPGSASP
ncbi:hypothetical protein MRB53_041385 [Persea americana]|nr:hypothetical protein MRB53_041385 [Persea americana]